MIKVKDGYGKLIGTAYQGSANNLLLSNGGDLKLTDLFTTLTNVNDQLSITVGGQNRKLTVAYADKASKDASGNVITSTYATPSTSAMSGSTDITSTTAIGSGASVLLSTSGPNGTSTCSSQTTTCYTQYIVTQVQTTSSASAGDSGTVTLTV